LGKGEWLAWFSAAYWAFVLAAAGTILLFLRGRLDGEGALPQARLLFAAVPLAVGVHAAYQAGFLPLAGQYTLVLGLAANGGAGAALAVWTAIFWVLFFKFGSNFYQLYCLIN